MFLKVTANSAQVIQLRVSQEKLYLHLNSYFSWAVTFGFVSSLFFLNFKKAWIFFPLKDPYQR